MKMKKIVLPIVGLSLALGSIAVKAHDIYIWPNYFTLNSKKPTTVPVDISASHTPFRVDFSMASKGLEIYGVDGKKVKRKGAYFEGARRSTFDLPVNYDGTYKLNYISGPSYFSSYTVGKRDAKKHMRSTKSEALAKMPEGAKNLETARYLTKAISYVTNNAPSDAVLAPSNEGFELVSQTHPADYVTGEVIKVKLLLDGEPTADQEVIIELEGAQYRETPVVMNLKSNAAGEVKFTFEEGGRYMLKVKHKQPSDDPEADVDITRIFYAFEVIYE